MERNTTATTSKPAVAAASPQQQPSATAAPPPQPPALRYTKRVYVLLSIAVGLVALAIMSEGAGGLVTVAVALLALRFFWWVASVLVLHRVPFFHHACSVLFKWTTTDERRRPKAVHVSFD